MFALFTIRVIHEHRHHLEGEMLMAIAAAFQAQVDRLNAYVTSLEGGASAQSDDDTAALTSALDAVGAPPAVPPAE